MNGPFHELADFSDHIGETFHFVVEGLEPPANLELVEAKGLGEKPLPELPRDPFSLLFKVTDQRLVGQLSGLLRHDTVPEAGVLLVPVQPGEDARFFEALFN